MILHALVVWPNNIYRRDEVTLRVILKELFFILINDFLEISLLHM